MCPQRPLACGERAVNASYEAKYLTSGLGSFRENITCVYQIQNPIPENYLYFTVFRKTNDSEIALYFTEDQIDGTREFSTIVYQTPNRVFHDLDPEIARQGEPFHNVTDQVKHYVFKGVS